MSRMLQNLQNVANVTGLQSVANVAELQKNVANAVELSKFCRDFNKCFKRVRFPKICAVFHADALVLRTDHGNLQALMPFEHMPFLLLLLRGPSEAAISCAM